MTGSRRWIAGGLAAAVALLALLVASVLYVRRARPVQLSVSVPASWERFRMSPGHSSHVEGGKAICSDCHDLARDGFKNASSSRCASCHKKEGAQSHRGGAGKEATGCLSCHAFGPDQASPTCLGCHEQPRGKLAALVDHRTTGCGTCHKMHESPVAVAVDCAACHEERAAKHAEHAGSAGCRDCHRGHDAASAARAACASCHEPPRAPPPAGHDSCLGCHKPHDFAADGRRTCQGCHGVKATLAAAKAPAHAVCISCHQPHAPLDAARSCVKCHAEVRVEHGSQSACTGCHKPHGDAPLALAATCTSCHAKVAPSDTGAHAGGVACERCHKPHAPRVLDQKSLCTQCHAGEAARTTSAVGHQNCASCHGEKIAHAPARAPACATCHAPEKATAPAGHQRCASCHEAHSGQVVAPCGSCHEAKRSGLHAQLQGGCATCHRPHGPGGVAAPPGCVSCHNSGSLPALHASPGHASCAQCHSSHAAPRADRAACTGACHVNKRNHQPEALICTGCHVFRR